MPIEAKELKCLIEKTFNLRVRKRDNLLRLAVLEDDLSNLRSESEVSDCVLKGIEREIDSLGLSNLEAVTEIGRAENEIKLHVRKIEAISEETNNMYEEILRQENHLCKLEREIDSFKQKGKNELTYSETRKSFFDTRTREFSSFN